MQINLASAHLDLLTKNIREKKTLNPQDIHQIAIKLNQIRSRLKQTCGQLQISSKSVIDEKGSHPESINQYTNSQTKNLEQKNASKVFNTTSNFKILYEMAASTLANEAYEN